MVIVVTIMVMMIMIVKPVYPFIFPSADKNIQGLYLYNIQK